MDEVSEKRTAAAQLKVAYSIDEFCEAYGVGRTLAYEEVAAGRLLTRKAGRRTLIRAVDAQAWLDGLPSGKDAA
ncbi:hypothetical protein MesoLjLc_49500 [Mesorhizobium sp. L-8-10]|nr:hypothetical protein MesoLjLc_49500 [Mesorhizobium sp. L-8-10]